MSMNSTSPSTSGKALERHERETRPLPRNVNDATLPYAGTSGHSGTDTSEERARTEDADGTTAKRQRMVVAWLQARGHYGGTVRELRQRFVWHHGQASAALTNSHQGGKIARLTEKRDRCKVYVAPEFVLGREVEKVQRNTSGYDEGFREGRAAGAAATIDAIYEEVRKGAEPLAALETVASRWGSAG